MDTSALVELLDASLRLWGVRARAQPSSRPGLAARVLVDARAPIHVSRHLRGEKGLPVWRLESLDAPSQDHIERASLGALLRSLREQLDPDYVAGAAIIGVRPARTEAQRAADARTGSDRS